MKKLIILLLAVMMFTACGQDKENDQGAVYVNITAEEAKEIMDTEEGYVILDVREQDEYDAGHISGAILIPYTQIEAKANEMLPDNELLAYLDTIGINAFRIMPDLPSVCEAVERKVKDSRSAKSTLFKKK